MIKIEDAFCIKNSQIIFKNISLSSNAKTIGICGANGIGKSTFLLQFMGVDTNAKVFDVLGVNMLKDKDISDFGIVFQDAKSTLNPMFDIGRYVLFLSRDKNILNAKEKTLELCELFKLRDIWHSYPHELSIGESKKFSLILALLKNPKLLILDELSAGLDEGSVEFMIEYLKNLDMKIILSSHDKRLLDFCDERYEFLGDRLDVIKG